MKSLQQLQDQAQLALANRELVEVAENFSPTAAYDRALALHYNEDMARSCRFLAIIRRDHGTETIKQMLESKKQVGCDNLYTEMVAPGIKALEALVGAPLRIVEPEDRGLTLTQYLEMAKPSTIGLGLELGGYKIQIESKVRHSDGRYDLVNKFAVISATGEKLAEEAYFRSCRDEERTEQTEMRRNLHWFLHRSLFSLSSWPHGSALVVIRNDFEKQGTKVAPRLWQYCKDQGTELWQLTEYGLIDQLQKIAQDLREKAVADGVGVQALGFLDLEVHLAMREAVRHNEKLDNNVLLVDKLRDGKFGVGYQVVPGPKAAKTYNFLLHMEYGMDNWVELLEKKGYGGSVVIAFFNIGSGMEVARTGQCDALLLQQHGIREKDDILDKAQEAMEKAQTTRGNSNVPKLPRFKFDPGWSHDETCGGFDKFLDKHLPLK